MTATITITIKNIESWDQYKDFGIPQIEEDLKTYVDDELSDRLGFDEINVSVDYD